MEESYKYDVAFSFLSKDENVALQLTSLLKERVNVFICTEKQKELAGRDGEVLLNRVYSKDSRIVVVLYRKDWGKSSWTSIEERAIRNRGFEEKKYNFLLFINLETNVAAPEWLPSNMLLLDFQKYGLQVAASTIEIHVQEFGGKIKIETVADKAKKQVQEKRHNEEVKRILSCYEGIKLLKDEFNSLQALLQQLLQDLKLAGWPIRVTDNEHKGYNIYSYGYTFITQYYPGYTNTTEQHFIALQLWDGFISGDGPVMNAKELDVDCLDFTINEFNQYGWVNRDTRTKFCTTEALCNKWLSKFIDLTSKRMDTA